MSLLRSSTYGILYQPGADAPSYEAVAASQLKLDLASYLKRRSRDSSITDSASYRLLKMPYVELQRSDTYPLFIKPPSHFEV